MFRGDVKNETLWIDTLHTWNTILDSQKGNLKHQIDIYKGDILCNPLDLKGVANRHMLIENTERNFALSRYMFIKLKNIDMTVKTRR